MNAANTPKGGSPIAASARSESNTAYRGIVNARPLMACGSTSSPYRVRITCQASKRPLVAKPAAPINTDACDVAWPAEAANHHTIEKNDKLP